MMRITAVDVAKFKAALEKYRQAQEEERIRIERERQEKQRQDEERDRQVEAAMFFVIALAAVAGVIALIYFNWEFVLESLGYRLCISS